MTRHKIIIIGSGPTGLGAAYRLQQLGEHDFMIYERHHYAGGLATSFTDDQGFLWDIGGHVQFSHYAYFDDLMDSLLPDEWFHHMRESWVWMCNRFVPYPFQNNIHRLPKEVMLECLEGLIGIYKNKSTAAPKNFEEWILQTSGPGIAKHFLFPYNFKVWAHQPTDMNAVWVGERVAVTDLARVIKNILNNTDDLSWGPNNTFRYPKRGGTGEIWKRLAERIGYDKIALNHEVTAVDTKKKQLTFADGAKVGYDYLVSTMPIDGLVQKSNLNRNIKTAAKQLRHSTTHIIGIGLEGKPNKELASKCWMYFPENDCPFYRVTLFSKYSPYNVPDSKKHFSLMTEVSESNFKPVDNKTVVADVIQGLKNTKLISTKDKIVTQWYHKEVYGYPTPSVERDTALQTIQPELMRHNILSRGRFGMWKYEVSNQDHSLMQGVEAAQFLVHGIPEQTAWYPNIVNGPKPY